MRHIQSFVSITTLVISMTLTTQVLTPQNAHALVMGPLYGLSLGAKAEEALGGLFFIGATLPFSSKASPKYKIPTWYWIVFGIIILDDSRGARWELQPLTPIIAKELGISGDEADLYNRDLPETQQVVDRLLKEVALADFKSADCETCFEAPLDLGLKYRAALSPTTLAVLDKIRLSNNK